MYMINDAVTGNRLYKTLKEAEEAAEKTCQIEMTPVTLAEYNPVKTMWPIIGRIEWRSDTEKPL